MEILIQSKSSKTKRAVIIIKLLIIFKLKTIKKLIPESIKGKIRDRSYLLIDQFLNNLVSRNYFGFKIFYSRGNSLINRIRFFSSEKMYERNLVTSLINNTKNSNPVLIDIGANIGLISFGYMSKFNNCKIYAYEPGPLQRYCLAASIAENNLFNKIILSEIAISDKEGYQSFIVHGGVYNGLDGFLETDRSPDKGMKIIVRTDTLDSEVKNLNIDHVDIIKIDVEGAELFVLKGSLNTIKKFKPYIFIEISLYNIKSYNLTVSIIFDFIKSMDYKIYDLENNLIDSAEDLSIMCTIDDMFLLKPLLR